VAGSGRVIGLDLGEARIGVAVSDSGRRLATPYTVLERGESRAEDRRRLAALVEELAADEVVVGIPLSLDGGEGPAARAARAELEALGLELAVPVRSWDERLSTVEATRRRRLAEGPGRRRGARRVARRPVDAAAAAVILQSFLDSSGRS